MINDSTMRREWDERAKKDAFYYIASWQKSWDSGQFFESGERDYQSLVAPALSSLHFEPGDKAMLEIGCGIGRMTRSFARRFASVYALDVSIEMLRQGSALHSDGARVLWINGNGADLAFFKSESMDFVFSYLVLQHLPTEILACHCIREMIRVLKPGGAFQFQFNCRRQATMNWKGRLVWGALDWLREPIFGISLERASHRLASLFGLDPLAAGKTWRGAILDVREVLETVWRSDGAVQGVTGWGTTMTWCYGYKSGNRVAGAPDKPNQWLTGLSAKDRP